MFFLSFLGARSGSAKPDTTLELYVYVDLNQERDKSSDHERGRPRHIEVEPRCPQQRETELAVDDPRDRPGRREVTERMDARGDEPGDRTGRPNECSRRV